MHTCLPWARRMPPVTAAVPSKIWNKATNGRIDATSFTTSAIDERQSEALKINSSPGSLLNM